MYFAYPCCQKSYRELKCENDTAKQLAKEAQELLQKGLNDEVRAKLEKISSAYHPSWDRSYYASPEDINRLDGNAILQQLQKHLNGVEYNANSMMTAYRNLEEEYNTLRTKMEHIQDVIFQEPRENPAPGT